MATAPLAQRRRTTSSADPNAITSFAIQSFVPVKEELWVADQVRRECSCCQREFHALRRRHHCRGCGELLCADCSKYKLVTKDPVRIHEVISVRACAHCFDAYSVGEGEALHSAVPVAPIPRSRASSSIATSSARRLSQLAAQPAAPSVSEEVKSSTPPDAQVSSLPRQPRFLQIAVFLVALIVFIWRAL